MNDCCLAVIASYEALYDPPREGAALFCRESSTRLVYHEGVWGTEGL